MTKRTGIFSQSLSAFAFAVFVSCVIVACCGCSKEPAAQIRKKFDSVVENDLRTIAGEIPRQSLADSVYTRAVEYKDFDKGPYRVKAVVDFFYLKAVHVKRTVKYRYAKGAGKWERYSNEYIHY
jgi:hypothetical protein